MKLLNFVVRMLHFAGWVLPQTSRQVQESKGLTQRWILSFIWQDRLEDTQV